MGVERISAFGVIGEDPFGAEMKRLLDSIGMETTGLLVQREQWDTHVYMKPYDGAREQRRLDFGNFNQLHPSTLQLLLEKLAAAIFSLDIVIVNQQVKHGIHTSDFRKALSVLAASHPETPFVADSRDYPDEYNGMMRKLNIHEVEQLTGKRLASGDASDLEGHSRSLYERWKKPLFLTRGEHGCMIYDEQGFTEIPGLVIVSPVDPVGAGDSMLAGIASALSVGAEPLKAAELGSLVAGVTVQKLMQTGTATPDEIQKIGTDPDRCYRPDLARSPQKAVFHEGTAIEIVSSLPRKREFTHVIFDHDGTISTLRQGWEAIMEPMMVKSILGTGRRDADDAFHNHVVATVRDTIDKTTGMQTLLQMKALVNLVRTFKCVPEPEILDEFGYKKIYNDRLLAMVSGRVNLLERGELTATDFTLANAIEFLNALHQKGVTLYLASGTDQEDVEREAEILGYHHLFGNRVYGAVGDVTKEAKRMVLERILAAIGKAAHEQILTFGDGPVEIRETHKHGGYAVGVASDEIRRAGLNLEKRKRLVEAGADLIIPDYSQMDRLLPLLFQA